MPTLTACRDLFPICTSRLFLNHAAIAPPSLRVVERMNGFMVECAEQGARNESQWEQKLDKVRCSAAKLMGAKAEDIALVSNTSTGLSLIAAAFPWRPGDAVLVPVPDFPSNIHPWTNLERLGVEIIPVPRREGRIDCRDFARALTPGVRMVTLSSVYYANGAAADLEEIGAFCREKGLFFVVDAIQSLGVLPVDVERAGIDALAAGGHKWLLGPMGSAILYLNPDFRRRLHPPLVGWKSMQHSDEFSEHFHLRDDAAAFEPGTPAWATLFGLGAALELLAEIGAETVRSRIFALCDEFAGGLQARNIKIHSPLFPSRSTRKDFSRPARPGGRPLPATGASAHLSPLLQLFPRRQHFF
jgi:selenocysteine lyase/cysteine desulfurase